jgi:Flp pilus assembly protein protease CpaA
MMWLAQQSANGVGGTMNSWDLLLLVLMAITASAIVGGLVTLAFLLIRRSGQRSTRALRAHRRTLRGDAPPRRGPWSGTAVPT